MEFLSKNPSCSWKQYMAAASIAHKSYRRCPCYRERHSAPNSLLFHWILRRCPCIIEHIKIGITGIPKMEAFVHIGASITVSKLLPFLIAMLCTPSVVAHYPWRHARCAGGSRSRLSNLTEKGSSIPEECLRSLPL